MLHISTDLRNEILNAANAAYPLECCGLIEGFCKADAWHAVAVHRAQNLAVDPSNHFLIDPQVHFDLLRSLRGSERRIIGCFHSHPNGPATPSDRDRAMAIEENFLWLIAGDKQAEQPSLNAFVFDKQSRSFLPLDLSP